MNTFDIISYRKIKSITISFLRNNVECIHEIFSINLVIIRHLRRYNTTASGLSLPYILDLLSRLMYSLYYYYYSVSIFSQTKSYILSSLLAYCHRIGILSFRLQHFSLVYIEYINSFYSIRILLCTLFLYFFILSKQNWRNLCILEINSC